MKRLSKPEIDRLAQQLWRQREQAFELLMERLHGVKGFKTMPWEKAPKKGRDLLRQHAEMLHYHGKPNDWMQIDPKWSQTQ